MIQVALDAMGGDKAPSVVVEGAVMAAREYGPDLKIILTGPVERIKQELKKLDYSGDGIAIHEAPQEVGMDESPTEALKTKQNSGLVQCVGLQKKGVVQASVSAGNSGAMMAACLMILGRVEGVSRPAITCVIPSLNRRVVLLDCGANVDEKPSHLLHFAICGSIYAERVLNYKKPTVALLNVGEEEKKGPEVLQEAYQILKKTPLNFIGNVEGRDVVEGNADVIVTPGYTGNVALKLMEGFYELHKSMFGVIDTPAGRKFDKEWDYSNTGGALLLGLNGTGIITHGRAEAFTIKMALKTAYDMAANDVSGKIAQKIKDIA